MIKFESGKHLANYILKILRNTNAVMTKQEENTIKSISYLYDFIEFYVDIIECPVNFDSSFSTWINYAKNGNIKCLCKIVETSIQEINKFKNKDISFDKLFECLDLNMEYRNGYLESKPSSFDIYYPYQLEVIDTKIRNSTGILYCYSNPKEKLTNNYGCYLIYDYEDSGKIVYVGKSNSNLLNRACESAKERTNGKFSKIELLEMPSHADTNIYEMYYIAKYKPIYNTDSCCIDNPTFELSDIAKHHSISFVKEEPFNIKQLCFEKKIVTREEFWNTGHYLLYNEKNLENKRIELCNNIQGIIDGANIYSRKDLYEKDGYLCTLEVINRTLEPT